MDTFLWLVVGFIMWIVLFVSHLILKRRAARSQAYCNDWPSVTQLSGRDAVAFLDAIQNPPPPNEYLIAAMKEHSRADWFNEAAHAVAALKDLPDDWNQYGARKPNDLAMKWAHRGLVACSHLSLDAPRIAASVEEGVALTYRVGWATGTVEFYNEGSVVAVMSRGEGEPVVREIQGREVSDFQEAFAAIKRFLDSYSARVISLDRVAVSQKNDDALRNDCKLANKRAEKMHRRAQKAEATLLVTEKILEQARASSEGYRRTWIEQMQGNRTLREENEALRADLELMHLTAAASSRRITKIQPFVGRKLTKDEEMCILDEHSEKIRRNPALGRQMLVRAGILGEDGQLTEHYRPEKPLVPPTGFGGVIGRIERGRIEPTTVDESSLEDSIEI